MSGTPGELSFNTVWPSAERLPPRRYSLREGLKVVHEAAIGDELTRERLDASSQSAFGQVQLVLRLASRSAFSR